jgi:hypothetical protein
MHRDLARLIAKIHEAGLAADAWPDALQSLTATLGVAGAACIVRNKITGSVDWVCFSGLSAEFEPDYVHYYAPLDPFAPLLNVKPGWTRMSEILPEPFLRRSEWYNDFVRQCGVSDILGTRLVDTPRYSVIFGLHQQIGRSLGDKTVLISASVSTHLASAAERHGENVFGSVQEDEGAAANGPRYYFHVRNDRQLFQDEVGSVFSTAKEAAAHASVLAMELSQDDDWEGFVISVIDERGNEIVRVPVKDRSAR